MLVSRGPNLASCSAAIAAALITDIEARQEREEAAQRQRVDAWRAVQQHPDRLALQTLPTGRGKGRSV